MPSEFIASSCVCESSVWSLKLLQGASGLNIVPWGLEKLLVKLKELYGNPVFYITETGMNNTISTFIKVTILHFHLKVFISALLETCLVLQMSKQHLCFVNFQAYQSWGIPTIHLRKIWMTRSEFSISTIILNMPWILSSKFHVFHVFVVRNFDVEKRQRMMSLDYVLTWAELLQIENLPNVLLIFQVLIILNGRANRSLTGEVSNSVEYLLGHWWTTLSGHGDMITSLAFTTWISTTAKNAILKPLHCGSSSFCNSPVQNLEKVQHSPIRCRIKLKLDQFDLPGIFN